MQYRQKSETCCSAKGIGKADAGQITGNEEMLIEIICEVNREAERRFGIETHNLPLTAEFEIRDGFVIVSEITLG